MQRTRLAPDVQFEDGAGAPSAAGWNFVPAVELPVGALPDRIMIRQALQLPPRAFLALHVASPVPDAGREVVLHALGRLRTRGDVARLPVVGFLGTAVAESQELARELGIEAHVLWLGHRTPVERYLEAADALLVPTAHADPPGLVLDAMARGVPPIAARAPGTRRIVRHEYNGLLLATTDPEAWAHALRRLVSEPEAAARLGGAARTDVSASWNETVLANEIESRAYAQVLSRRPARRALFVDRDDTLVRDVPYNGDPEAVVLEPLAGRALTCLRAAGWKVLVVSNQSGVARGRLREADVHAVHARVHELLQAEGAGVDGFYFCTHHPDVGGACSCRKPAPGMLLQAASEHDIDLGRSVMVGDSAHDLEAGRRAGAAVRAYAPAHRSDALPDASRDWLSLACDLLRDAWRESK